MSWVGLSLSLSPDVERLVRTKRTFRDAHERRRYCRTVLTVTRLLANPDLVGAGRNYLEQFVRDDPRQRRVYRLWDQIIQLPVEQIALRLLADDAQGEALRESAPVFTVIPPQEVQALSRIAEK
jgi:hypothetical protein